MKRALVGIAVLVTFPTTTVAGPSGRTSVRVGESEERRSTKLKDRRAREHLAAGWAYYNDGEWDKAIEEWRKGALVEPSPVWNWNFGQANRQAGRFEKARWNYERFIAEATGISGTEDAIANARRFIEEIDAARTSPPRGPVEEPAVPTSTSAERPHRIAAATLNRTPAHAEAWSDDWIAWSLVGAGVVSASVGGGLFWSASGLQDDARNERNDERRMEMLDDVESRRETGGITLAVSGLVVLAGIVKLAVAPSRKSPASFAYHLDAESVWFGTQVRF